MTDLEAATILRRYQPGPGSPANPDWAHYDDAVEHAIKVLERFHSMATFHETATGQPLFPPDEKRESRT